MFIEAQRTLRASMHVPYGCTGTYTDKKTLLLNVIYRMCTYDGYNMKVRSSLSRNRLCC